MLCEKTFYELSLLSYFDTYAVNIPVSDMIRHIQEDEQLMQDYGQYPDFQITKPDGRTGRTTSVCF